MPRQADAAVAPASPTKESAGSPIAAPVQVGDILRGKYRVERLLGAGGMAYVVAAWHLDLEQRVAIKLLRPETVSDPEIVERFLREARAASRLESPHVARVTDVDRLESGPPFIVMEYLDGADLDQVLRARGPLALPLVAAWVREACSGVADAHALGIIHRDLKPANLFLAEKRAGGTVVKVLDFGISKLLENTRLTRGDVGMGSAEYASPEQLRSAVDVDPRSDVWSLGVTLYQLTTGVSPFHADGIAEVAVSVLTKDPAPPRSLRPDLPAGFEALILRCLSKDRGRRPSSATELADALAPFTKPVTPAPPARPAPTPPSAIASGSRAPLLGVALALALGLVVISSFALGRRERASAPQAVRGRYELAATTLRDTDTGLVWQRQPAPGAMDWASARAFCARQGGGFRLPDASELAGLLPVTALDPPLDTASFPTSAVDVFWASSQPAPGVASVVHFSSGRSGTSVTSGRNRVRCVRP